jgi:hypothetical protein
MGSKYMKNKVLEKRIVGKEWPRLTVRVVNFSFGTI